MDSFKVNREMAFQISQTHKKSERANKIPFVPHIYNLPKYFPVGRCRAKFHVCIVLLDF